MLHKNNSKHRTDIDRAARTTTNLQQKQIDKMRGYMNKRFAKKNGIRLSRKKMRGGHGGNTGRYGHPSEHRHARREFIGMCRRKTQNDLKHQLMDM